MSRRSQIQKQVLLLYRSLLREAGDRPGIAYHIQSEFRKNKNIPRTNIMQIEYLVRRGEKRLTELKNGQMTAMGAFVSSQPKSNKT